MNDIVLLEALIKEILLDEDKKKKAKKKRKSSAGNLSAATKEKLKKIADKKGYTAASVYAEYRAGLAAWATGHKPGVPQHAWAMARVNSASPSKKWAKVKKKKS